ncbi:leucine-rich repeat flightless-interacting protein 2-like [Mizuhopecten yessoensis]|uniref:Leucine-rich repeat flightless-interacting protein 2 n=1 Tax=Mizuhopecten yessoensis TaxID=6573 RepID=A0A210Q9J7_MIZYE|nr:leucine-rich repeat flightless-interacting protein 2-like [Mizuhopecten yessoensis]OWF45404.1 Leucine-rich repeat flightless-interacting protein 2 [Mizuhopecten yessoensis]
MSTSSATGRRRSANRQYSAEEQALNQISKEAESRLAAKRAARAEARDIRIKEIERQQKEEEERQRRQEEDGDKNRDILSSRRGSDDSSHSTSTIDDMEGPREMKDIARELKGKLREMDEKYKKAMMTNALLDNEKQSLVYRAELLKDQMEELEETLVEIQREAKQKNREVEMQKRDMKTLEFEHNNLKMQLEVKDKLIQESGLVILSTAEGSYTLEKCTSVHNTSPVPALGSLLISVEAADILDKAGDGSLDDKIKKFAEERNVLTKEIKKLQAELEEETSKREHSSPKVPQINGPEMQLYEVQREASKQIHEYKLKLQKAEQDITNLEGTVTRLDSQVKRYKTDAEESEKLEDELKTEKRKLQRELREAQNYVEELTNSNKHMQKRLEKMKQARNALVNQ